jgi:glycosyltransferase involved in cell wall biosynthesis
MRGLEMGEDEPRARVYVCTFCTEEYAGSAEALRYSALKCAGVDGAFVFSERDVRPFFDEYPELLTPGSRGYGWFAWKPYCVLQALARTRPGDVVVYCDAAIILEKPLDYYVAQTDHVLLFRLGEWCRNDYTNGRWTKRDTFAFMDRTSDEVRAAIQVNAAVQVYRNTPEAVAFAREWLRWCSERKVIDSAQVLQNPEPFAEHRWDQSILSILAVGHAHVKVARDPTQYGVADPTLLGDEPDEPAINHHRKRVFPASVAVITPTVGTRHLRACIESVQAQDIPNVVHWIVVDGGEHEAAVREVVASFEHRHRVHVAVLPRNVGADGWNGHRVYGAFPWLVDADFVCFLDEDNELEAEHCRLLLRACVAADAPWGFALRAVVDQDGVEVCKDNCESLGSLSAPVGNPGYRLVDTNCYFMRRDLAVLVSPLWNAKFRDPHGRPEPDRAIVAELLRNGVPHACVRRHTVRYRLGGSSNSVPRDFFVRANAAGGYDFAAYRDDVYVFHFSPDATARMLACRRDPAASHALDEWGMTLWKGLDGGGRVDAPTARYNLLDGYACMPHIPAGACVLVSLCMPDSVPWAFLKARTDVWRVAYTLESPNIRHKDQWDPVALAAHFDVVCTYWKAVLEDPRVNTVFCPHNSHHLDLDDPLDAAQLRRNRGSGTSCVMVLERRDLAGTYQVPNTTAVLTCLDGLREELVRGLRNVTVFGTGWDAAAARNPGLRIGHTLHRSQDPRSSVDILQDYSFAVIVENCDAEGYASEKLYDALMAGCVPLYYGSVPPQLAIPEGLDGGVYLDLKKLCAAATDKSAAIQAFLDRLAPGDVEAWKARVESMRAGILEHVGVKSFARIVQGAMDQRPV